MIPKLFLVAVAFIAQGNGLHKIPKGNSFSSTPWFKPQPQPQPQPSNSNYVELDSNLDNVMNFFSGKSEENWPEVWQMKFKKTVPSSGSASDISSFLQEMIDSTSVEDWELLPKNFDETKQSLHTTVRVPLPIGTDESKPKVAFKATDAQGIVFYGTSDTIGDESIEIWNFEYDKFFPTIKLEADLSKVMGFYVSGNETGIWFYARVSDN